MINPREIPFARWLLFFVIGVLSSLCFQFQLPHTKSILVISLIFCLISQRQKDSFRCWWIRPLPFYLFFIVLGYTITLNKNDLLKEDHFRNFLGNKSFIIGKIEDMPIKKKWVKFEMQTEGIGTNLEDVTPCTGKLLIYIEKDSLSEHLRNGDIIMFKNPIFEIEAPKNPHAFNYKQFLNYKNIHYQTFIKSPNWKLLKKNEQTTINSLALSLRTKFLDILRKYLKEENQFAVGSALILGYKDEISEEVQTAYADTGAMHVLAVSGLHVGIVYLILQILLINRINSVHPLWKIGKVAIPLFGIWAFALLTGMPPSVKRAATMFSIFIFGTALARTRNSYNILAASAFWILVFDPYLIMSVSFQLSYSAVFGILYFQPRIAKLWVIKNEIGNYFWQLSAMSLAAQLGTAPLGLFYFHQFPIYFLLSGLIVIPAAFLILNLGLALFLFESINSSLGTPFGWALNKLIELVNWLIFQIQHLPGSVIGGIWISGTIAFLIYLIIGKTAIAFEKKNFKWIIGSLSILTLVSLSYSFTKYQHSKNRKIVFYHLNRSTVIDFFDGSDLISITSENTDSKALGYAVQNNRWAEGAKNIQTYHFQDSTEYILDRWFYHAGFIQFYDKKIATIDAPSDTLSNSKIEVDYLLVRNNPKINIQSLLNHYDFEQIIFDASNSRWKVEKWIDECYLKEISFHNIQKDGAFTLNLNGS